MNSSTKSWLFATASSLALATGSANAADAPVAPPVKAPAALPLVTWTGPYAGLNIGAARHHFSFETSFGGPFISDSLNETGLILGGQVGYNWQSGIWVTGVEADINWLDVGISRSYGGAAGAASSDVDWLATLRGRLGVTLSPPTLLYLTGGLAVARVENGWMNSLGYVNNARKTKAGAVLGGGIEHQFGRNWTGRAEVLYVGLGKTRASSTIAGGTYATEFKNRLLIGRVAFNYRW
jgi:outer membrane immunogenic protein